MRQTDGPGQLVADPDEDTPGLGELHVALYRRALEHGWLDPVQAALRLGHSLAEVDAAVHDLVRLHLLRGDPDGPDDPDGPPGTGCYLPCSPNAAAAHLTGSIEAEIRRRHREAERLRSHVMALNPVFEESWQGSYEQNPIVHLTLPDTVRSTLEQLSAGTRGEVAAAHPLLPPQQALEEGLARTTEVIGRGISMRTLYPHSVLAHRYMQQHLSRMTALGAEIRTTGQIPDRILFFDWETAVIADSGAGAGTGAILVRDPALVGHLRRSWESSWESALPFSSSPGGTGYGSAKDSLRRSVLQLLESGMKDEVAARRLSMSTSSYRRHVTDLMNDLGAESRFQAGSFARREGWLDG
ncbi:hypothetical protein GCM10010441_46020 [Kitasatospora paracochleata]|uniref:HTH luxR-type domain-containing protein n=1 Tax=Kitasatospora paracochleata TaxID=58354 RepID=A0ABT1J6B6_9ACTN|nr:hypothetical protein [Kitasatospora paracochleata]MCP2312982.1 hypothetical protein [Kitasatospora paracochleata]